VDFDWEYPGATDIPNIDPGSPDEGANYLDFLRTLKSMIPQGKSLSMAIPSGYWYLRGFPLAAMSDVIDYFIYMTYDLHGRSLGDTTPAFSLPRGR
jgi:GH18 family chitinase